MLWLFIISGALIVLLFASKAIERRRDDRHLLSSFRDRVDKMVLEWYRHARRWVSVLSTGFFHHSYEKTTAGKSWAARLLRRIAEKLE